MEVEKNYVVFQPKSSHLSQVGQNQPRSYELFLEGFFFCIREEVNRILSAEILCF